ncbi:MAG: amidohydrolase family protein, partial [Gammaproteobacteria bacterium]|nr:amidohydrolase family protein [Gammaproteobacteria bacterium]
MTIKVFTAKKIITMNPSWPDGTAVAVRDGRILEVGSLESLEPWLTRDEHEIVDFGDAIVLPGLIDPHLHPVMAAVLLPMHFVTALEWDLPWQTVPACPDQESYRQKIAELEAEMVGDEPFFSWGFHASWHGDMSREVLDAISTTRPMVVWHRSFHEVYLNSAMLELLEITQEGVGARQQIDFERGHFYEVGLGYAIQKLNRFIMSDEWILKGLDRLKQIVH